MTASIPEKMATTDLASSPLAPESPLTAAPAGPGWLAENLAVLKQRQPREAELLSQLAALPQEGIWRFPLATGEIILSPGPHNFPLLTVDLGRGPQRLVSARDPQREDRLLAADFWRRRPRKGLWVLGLGLGYHLDYLAEKLPPGEPLWIWEASPQLAAAALTARDFRPLLKRSGWRLFLGPQAPPQAPTDPNEALARPANLRLFGHLYPRPQERRPPKPPKILFLSSGYYLGQEIPRAAQALRSPARQMDFDPVRAEGRDYQGLLRNLKEFRPELVLTVNHLGLDEDGILVDILGRLGLPLASWFVDSPLYILRPGPQGDVFVFSWDRDYLEPLKAMGFPRVAYLPLATDPDLFAPRPGPITRELAFVGDSLTAATQKYLALSGLGPETLPEIDQLARLFLKSPDLAPTSLAARLVEREKLNPERARSLGALITWRASRLYRVKVLKALSDQRPEIRGDAGWGELLPGLTAGPQVDYYQDLAPFYRSSAINLNITSAQMKTGLNQRVFDAPAAGGFVLTDYRKQLLDLFAPDEVVTYQSPAEAKTLAREYLRKPQERQRITQKAQRRILGEHLYSHRLAEIFRQVFGSRP
ncbi:MAG: glycosyltransferase [Deltaproteobacteria bacterium]|jgi:spore maturation protein CgeB|nr:glycosyltransferase [Deltaproteobacteria bacterium]